MAELQYKQMPTLQSIYYQSKALDWKGKGYCKQEIWEDSDEAEDTEPLNSDEYFKQ